MPSRFLIAQSFDVSWTLLGLVLICE